MSQNTQDNEHVPVGFYLSTPKIKDDVLNNKNSSNDYIILMNDTLQKEIRSISKERDELLKEANEHEKEMDKLEVSTQYLRKMLINIVELRKMTDNVKDKYKTLHNQEAIENEKNVKYIESMVCILKQYFVFLFCTSCTLCVLNYISPIVIIHYITINIICFSILYLNNYTLIKFCFPKQTNVITTFDKKKKIVSSIKEINEDIKKVEESHDFLNELITNA